MYLHMWTVITPVGSTYTWAVLTPGLYFHLGCIYTWAVLTPGLYLHLGCTYTCGMYLHTWTVITPVGSTYTCGIYLHLGCTYTWAHYGIKPANDHMHLCSQQPERNEILGRAARCGRAGRVATIPCHGGHATPRQATPRHAIYNPKYGGAWCALYRGKSNSTMGLLYAVWMRWRSTGEATCWMCFMRIRSWFSILAGLIVPY